MKILEVTPKDYYTCQFCGNSFISNSGKPLIIEQGFYPVCSFKCGFMVIFTYIQNQEYSNENLEIMLKIIGKNDEIQDFDRKTAIYSISKYYAKLGLANIKFIGTSDKDKKTETRNLTSETRDKISPPMLIGGMSLSCPCFENGSSMNPCPIIFDENSKKEVKKWF